MAQMTTPPMSAGEKTVASLQIAVPSELDNIVQLPYLSNGQME